MGEFELPDGEINEYRLVESCPHGQRVLKDTTVTDANKTLADLDEQSGTGPDSPLLPERV